MNSKRFGLLLAAPVLALFSAAVFAGPPGGGMGGGRGAGGMTPAPGHTDMDHSARGTSDAAAHGPSVSDKLADDTRLAARIKELTGSDAQTACAGFKTVGDCVAAAHVSKNLDIPFDTLHSRLTGNGAVSLGKAVHALRPDADAKAAAADAGRQTRADLKTRG
jgi:hypothetical protein